MGIRDTSAQDRPVASPTTPAVRKRRNWWLIAGTSVTGLLLVGWLSAASCCSTAMMAA